MMISKINKLFNKKKNSINEAQKRRKRSESILKEKGIPINQWLPLIENEADSNIRTREEVSRRALALCLVAVKGEGLEQPSVLEVLNQYDIEPYLTPLEREFIFSDNPTEQEKIQFSWKYECYWVMLWVLSYIDDLGYPDDICDVPRAVKFMANTTVDKFIQNAKLRSGQEILDEADLIYCYHWAVRDASINNKKILGNLEQGVVMERHHALNWLIGYMDLDWDDVTTDT